jgi:hypothetical protein
MINSNSDPKQCYIKSSDYPKWKRWIRPRSFSVWDEVTDTVAKMDVTSLTIKRNNTSSLNVISVTPQL